MYDWNSEQIVGEDLEIDGETLHYDIGPDSETYSQSLHNSPLREKIEDAVCHRLATADSPVHTIEVADEDAAGEYWIKFVPGHGQHGDWERQADLRYDDQEVAVFHNPYKREGARTNLARRIAHDVDRHYDEDDDWGLGHRVTMSTPKHKRWNEE